MLNSFFANLSTLEIIGLSFLVWIGLLALIYITYLVEKYQDEIYEFLLPVAEWAENTFTDREPDYEEIKDWADEELFYATKLRGE